MSTTSARPTSADALDLAHWLEPGEEVRWQGRQARSGLPWGALLATLAASGLAFWFFFLFQVKNPSAPVGAALVVAVLVIQLVGARSVQRSRSLERYVLTDRRAAVFELPGELRKQIGVASPFFSAHLSGFGTAGLHLDRQHRGLHAPGAIRRRRGTVDWGESDLRQSIQGRIVIRNLAWTLGIIDPQRVVFADVDGVDELLEVARRTRDQWGATTPGVAELQARWHVPEPLGFLDTPKAGRMNAAALAVGTTVLLAAAALWVLTMIPGQGAFNGGNPIKVMLALLVPLLAWTVVVLAGRRQRPGQAFLATGEKGLWGRAQLTVFTYLSRWLVAIMLVVFVGALVSAKLGTPDLPGQPAYNPQTHHYSYREHGVTVRVTRARYLQIVTAENRLFVDVVALLGVLAVGVAGDEVGRRRRSRSLAPVNAPPVSAGT